MTIYRVQAVNANFWRGARHRWQTTFHFNFAGTANNSAFDTLHAVIETLCEGLGYSPGAGTGTYSTYCETKIYAGSGVPVYSNVRADWTDGTTWLGKPGNAYGSITGASVPNSSESAALLVAHLGLSRTGKPVLLRKYIHDAPTIAASPGAPNFNTSQVSTANTFIAGQLATAASAGFQLCSPSGTLPVDGLKLQNELVAHQRLRGRRRRLTVAVTPSP